MSRSHSLLAPLRAPLREPLRESSPLREPSPLAEAESLGEPRDSDSPLGDRDVDELLAIDRDYVRNRRPLTPVLFSGPAPRADSPFALQRSYSGTMLGGRDGPSLRRSGPDLLQIAAAAITEDVCGDEGPRLGGKDGAQKTHRSFKHWWRYNFGGGHKERRHMRPMVRKWVVIISTALVGAIAASPMSFGDHGHHGAHSAHGGHGAHAMELPDVPNEFNDAETSPRQLLGRFDNLVPPEIWCPVGCVSYFDGCNDCSCNGYGEKLACTRKYCLRKEPHKCKAWDFPIKVVRPASTGAPKFPFKTRPPRTTELEIITKADGFTEPIAAAAEAEDAEEDTPAQD